MYLLYSGSLMYRDELRFFYLTVDICSSYSCKRVGGQTCSEKRTAWRNQELKETIWAKKTAFKTWLTNNSFEQLRLRYFAADKIPSLLSYNLKISHRNNLDKSWIQTTDRQTKYFLFYLFFIYLFELDTKSIEKRKSTHNNNKKRKQAGKKNRTFEITSTIEDNVYNSHSGRRNCYTPYS